MEMNNQFMIEGIICVEPELTISPSGFPYRHWTMQHQSERYEGGIRRKAWLRVKVVASGQELVDASEAFKVGTVVRCAGFLSALKTRKGDTQIVLYSETVEALDESQFTTPTNA